MIVHEIMTTHLVTVEPDETPGHAVSLLRQHQFHHLPVARKLRQPGAARSFSPGPAPALILQGLVTTEDIERAAALAEQESAKHSLFSSWQQRLVVEVMRRPQVWVSPTTSVAVAASLLVEHNLSCVPIIETDQEHTQECNLLVGLLTRSDRLLALARVLDESEPGTQICVQLPAGWLVPLVKTLVAADDLHLHTGSLLLLPGSDHHPQSASLRLNTINPGPLLTRLQQDGVKLCSDELSLDAG